MLALTAVVIALASAKLAAAHGGVLAYSIGSTWYKGFTPYNTPVGQSSIQREWDTYDPIQDPTLAIMACNTNGAALALQLTATVAAGTPITAYWNNPWPHNIGPMLTYMANCGGSCTTADATTLNWFKIDQAGLISGTVASGIWGDTQMMANNNSWTSTIPSCIPTGNYMIRFETIALHSQPAQYYPECAQLSVTNGGSTTPGSSYLVKFPGAYSATDPGLGIDVYGQAAQTQTTYVIPGPPLFTCSGGGSTGTTTTKTTTTSTTSKATSTTSKATTTSTTSKATTTSTTSKATTTSTTSGGTVAHYGQCGGSSYTGPTTCASPYTCVVSNEFYSQCL